MSCMVELVIDVTLQDDIRHSFVDLKKQRSGFYRLEANTVILFHLFLRTNSVEVTSKVFFASSLISKTKFEKQKDGG